MAQQADGTVYINSSIDTDGFTAGGKEIEAAARRAAKTVKGIGDAARIALERQTAAFVKSNQLYAQQEQKVQDLENKLLELGQQKIPTEGFKKLEKEAEALNIELEKVKATQKEWIDMGFSESDAISKTKKEYDAIIQKIEQVKQKQAELEKAGIAYTAPDTSGVEQKLIAEKQRLMQMNTALNVSYDSLKNKIEQYGGSIAGAAQKHGLLRKALSSVAGVAKKAGAAMLLFHKNTKKSNGSIGTGIKNMLKYTLGISSLLVLFRKIKSAVKEGMQNLVQYSNETNTHLSALKSSMTQLKNSLATAFNPILTVIEPILTRFINLLSQAATYVGMFFAAMTGKNSFTKAVAVQEDYAASLGDTADNAKEAKKYLSGLDEIRTYSDNKDTSGGGAGGISPADMFETVPIESKIKEFADKVKQIFTKMFAPLRQVWDKYGDSIMGTLGKIKDSFVDFGVRIANSTIDWFKNLNWEPLLASVDNLLNKLQPLIDVILNGLAWAYENVLLPFGKWTIEKALPVILDDLGKAFEFIRVVLEALQPVFTWLWGNVLKPFGETVGEVVIDILTAFGGLLDFLIGVFTGDWERAFEGLKTVGESLRDAIFSIFDFIKNVLNVFDEFLQGVFAKDWTEYFGLFGNIINDFFDLVQVVWNLIKEVFEGVIQFFRGVFTGDWEQAWNGIKQIFNSVWEAIKGVVQVAVNVIKDIINLEWNTIKATTSTVWNGIKSSVSSIWNSIKTQAFASFSGIKSNITNAWSSVKTSTFSVWESIKNTVSNAWNTINNIVGKLTGVFTNAISSAKNAASNIISAFSNIHIPLPHFSIGSTSHSIAGVSFSLPSISVDWYAKGGLFDQPSVIGVGEAGQEAVLPLTNSKVMSLLASNIVAKMPAPYLASGAVVPPKAQSSSVQVSDSATKNMESMYNMMASMVDKISQNQGLNGDINLTVQLDSAVVFRKVIDRAKLQQTVSGRNPFLLGT